MGDIGADLGFVINQQQTSTQPMQGALEALVVSADDTGVRVKIPSFHPDWAFGPCRYSWPGTGYPPANTACLVQFTGTDLTSPWVIAWAAAPQPQGQSLALPGATTPTRFVGGTVAGPPTSGTFTKGDFVVGQDGAVWVCTTGGSPGTWTASYTAALGKPAALLGAAAATRYAGGTASGAPTTGQFAKGDFVIAEDGNVWICTTAGTPGTWAPILGSPRQLPGTGVATRYAGGTASNHPTAGTFAVGDFVVAQDGVMWVCTGAGTPGTWVATYTPALGKSAGLTIAAARFAGGSLIGAPTSGTFTGGDFVIDQSGKVWICTASGTPGTWVDASAAGAAAVKGQPMGLTGATSPTRFVGGAVSGPPTAGTFAVGDFVITQDGRVYVCSVAGTPGTWVTGYGGGSLRSGWNQIGVNGNASGTRYVISGLGAVAGVQASPATMSAGVVTLHKAGNWALTLMARSDNGAPHFSLLEMSWPNGAWAPVFDVLTDKSYAGAGFPGGGEIIQVMSWTGYVTSAQANAALTLAITNTTSDASQLTGLNFWFIAEYLGGA